MILNDTIAAVATAPGKGGIAVIRLSGSDAYNVASQVFVPKNANKSLDKCPGYSALFGDFHYEGRVLDEGIALCFHTPTSYTGEDIIEFNCHGSEVICREILMACYGAGARPALPGEYTKRAFLNGRMSLTQAEAVMDLVSASSRRSAQAAKVALTGGTQRLIDGIKAGLITAAGHLAAWIDYPEEDVEEVDPQQLEGAIEAARDRLSDLIDKYDRGAAIKRGVRAAIVGSPNVGKSTLFNVLAGIDRSIVTDIAGTTRDVVREEISVGGIPFYLSDTAGLRDTRDIVEFEGVKRSYDEIERAEMILAVFDGSLEATDADAELAKRCAGRNAIAVINKNDLESRFDKSVIEQYFAAVIDVSAKEESAKDQIEKTVTDLLAVSDIDPNEPMLANSRQLAAAQEARSMLADAKNAMEHENQYDVVASCLDEALQALTKLTGENASEEVIEEIFSKFCVGK